MRRAALLIALLAAGCGEPAGPGPGPGPEAEAPLVGRVLASPAEDDAPVRPLSPSGPVASPPAPAFEDELSAERRMQLSLPKAEHPTWDTLRTTRIDFDETTGLYRAAHAAPVRRMEGRRVTVRGYMLPLEAAMRTRRFLISPYTPVCFFHPPAEPNEVIEVRLSRPIDAGYHLVEATGVLRLTDDGEKGLFFVLEDARGRVLERAF